MNEYVFIIRGKIQIYPPCISQIVLLSKHVKKTTVICSECNDETYKYLMRQKIDVKVIGNKRISRGFAGKLGSYLYFRNKVSKLLTTLDKKKSMLWFGTADSAFCMYGKLNGWKYMVNSLELYDNNTLYRKGLSLVLKDSQELIVPEYNRALIMKYWFSLSKMPIVMPNKNFDHPRKKDLNTDNIELKSILAKIEGKKVIIFQGLIMWSIQHLKNIAKALSISDGDYILLLLGNKDKNVTKELTAIYENVISIGYIPAPNHLVITSNAYLGIATYDESSLNNLYCAPNKIYEYAGFGIPTLGAELPGLRYSIGTSNAGIITDLNKVENIVEALGLINKNYDEYSFNSLNFFNEVDNEKVIKEIVESYL